MLPTLCADSDFVTLHLHNRKPMLRVDDLLKGIDSTGILRYRPNSMNRCSFSRPERPSARRQAADARRAEAFSL
jgi:hypothetical protein